MNMLTYIYKKTTTWRWCMGQINV